MPLCESSRKKKPRIVTPAQSQPRHGIRSVKRSCRDSIDGKARTHLLDIHPQSVTPSERYENKIARMGDVELKRRVVDRGQGGLAELVIFDPQFIRRSVQAMAENKRARPRPMMARLRSASK